MSNKNENKALITPEQIAKENANLLPALQKAEAEVAKNYGTVEKSIKAVCIQCYNIKEKELYKAKGYTSINKYCADNNLKGVSSSTISNYIKVAENFLCSTNPERKALADKLNYTQLAEAVTFSDDDVKNLASRNDLDTIKAADIRAMKEEKAAGSPKVKKSYDVKAIFSKPEVGAQWYGTEHEAIDLDYFIESNDINRSTINKVGKLDNGLKDSYAYTALSNNALTIFYYTAAPHVTKAESNYKPTKEAREDAAKAFIESMSEEERRAFFASFNQ